MLYSNYMIYCTRLQVEAVFGRRNLESWADLDNNEDPDAIAAVIDSNLDYASDEVDSDLIFGPYNIPFVAPYPLPIVRLAALVTGIMTYDGRRITSPDKDILSQRRKEANCIKQDILNGRKRLVHPTTKAPLTLTSYSAPFVVTGAVGEVIEKVDNMGLDS